MAFFGREELSNKFFTNFCIEMELDHNFSFKTFDEFKSSLNITEKYIEDANKNEIESLNMVKRYFKLNFKSVAQRNLEETNKNLHKIIDPENKAKILMSLIKDAAFNYNKYLGFTLTSDIGNLMNSSFDEICALKSNFFRYDPENYTVFLLEIITNYFGPDYDDLISNQMKKIRDIKNFFKSLCYYDKVKEFYDKNFQAFKFKEFFSIVFLLIFNRVNKMFAAEIDFENNYIFIEETRRKLSSLEWDKMQRKIQSLIDELELRSILRDFNDFYIKLKKFFKNYIDWIVLRARKGYLKNKDKKSIYIEKSSSIISTGFTAFRISTSESFKFGFYINLLIY